MNDELHDLAAAYAVDALDDDERAAFERHLVGCERCTAEVAQHAEAAHGLAAALAVAPPAHLRASVLGQLDNVDQDVSVPEVRPTPPQAPIHDQSVASLDEHRRRRFSVANVLSAAAVVALITIGAVVLSSNRGGSDFDEVAAASDAVVTVLDGDTGTVEVIYSAELDRVAVQGRDLDDLGPGLRYALWAIADGTPIPAGLFEPGDGSVEFVTELAGVSAQAWGVTIEPASGSDAPTGDILLFAEV